MSPPSVLPGVTLFLLAAGHPVARAGGVGDSALLRYADPPVLVSTTVGPTWRATVDCAPPVSLPPLIGARVGFTYDFDLDGIADATDSLGVSPADCTDDGESGPGRIALSRRLGTGRAAAVLRADLLSAADSVAARHVVLTGGAGSLLRIARYCARPRNGEPEWIEVRNVSSRPVSLAQARLEGRALFAFSALSALSGTLAPGDAFVAGSDTAELRLWQPGARVVPLSSWSNLRNSGDTIRLTLAMEGAGSPNQAAALLLTLDSLVYGPAVDPSEACASAATEGSAAAASGYALEFSAPRWSRASRVSASSGSAPFTLTVRAPAGGRYDLFAYDLDGRPLCTLARDAAGPASFTLPASSCPALDFVRAGRVILHLSPRHAPGLRTLLRIGP